MPMNIAWISSSGRIECVSAVIPPRSDEYVSQSRLTSRRCSGLVVDQYPRSSGYSVIFFV